MNKLTWMKIAWNDISCISWYIYNSLLHFTKYRHVWWIMCIYIFYYILIYLGRILQDCFNVPSYNYIYTIIIRIWNIFWLLSLLLYCNCYTNYIFSDWIQSETGRLEVFDKKVTASCSSTQYLHILHRFEFPKLCALNILQIIIITFNTCVPQYRTKQFILSLSFDGYEQLL